MADRDNDVEDDEDDDVDTTAPCPSCDRPIYDDAEWCPHCGKYLSREEWTSRRSWWFVAGVLACLLVILGWVIG